MLKHTLLPLTLLAVAGCSPQVAVIPNTESAELALDAQTILDTTADASRVAAGAGAIQAKAAGVTNPILFVTQVPTRGDEFASRGSTFANHGSHIMSAPRGGDLMIRYPDGTVRNLTQEAGFGMTGQQGANAIAVREPTVHWDGQKAVFSMLTGAPPRYQHTSNPWQIYEVSGLGVGQTVKITKVPGQPAAYNNVSPLYTSDDKILFTSDRPRDGRAHLHPQLDEYESTPTIVGIYKLDPSNGQVELLNHTPSGAFSPTIDSAGRVVFIRWDHLQRDQQADAGTYGANNYANEDANTAAGAVQPEVFPEARLGMSSPYGAVNGFTYNLFTPWEMNQDGTHELSLNHIGRQELSFGYLGKSFANDNHLQDNTGSAPRTNNFFVRNDGGLFHMREDPTEPGTYYTVYSREFYELSSGRILRMRSAVGMQAEAIGVVPVSPEANVDPGRFRDVQPLTSGNMVVSYLPQATVPATRGGSVRLYNMVRGANGQFTRGEALTPGISKTVTWWDPDNAQTYSGLLWELEPAEVVARTRPPVRTMETEQGERTVFQQEGVDETAFRTWMRERNLALVVVRNQTHRDRGDRQQPFNLRVPGGVSTTATNGPLYDISHFQIFQANLVRGYTGKQSGRRSLPQPTALDDALHPTRLGPASSVGISPDGSSAAFVPAKRALTWQTTDANGEAIVRERLWVTMQPGEIRTCSGCHGENVAHQGGGAASTAPTQAMRDLLRHWKAQQGPRRANGSQPLVPNRG